ncbi:ABC transporter ATP-binding protein [Albidovulum sediminicola]|uniref:Spermidine/putrescine import ATP-binding protein PotA n=1 Tax=Albidovulum sediminicola TaxID=2984331 RepID=A0ABT2Z425_9RHOB|nr:ABC transporter ATP-binding protein [Defluviimonas sp. WL0075]MCV2865847.1 ABC transporter ATP-binding protein [Defluviimonas sp. WL0075]
MSSDDALIEIVDVTKAFGAGERRFLALGGVNATIRKGEFFTLLGPSGCGKTTLLRLIAGFELPSSGEIRLDGQEIGHLPPFRRPVNTVFQNYALFPHMTVAQNIAFGLEMLGKPKAEIAATVERMLTLVKMTELAGRRTDQLSGGQQQRVALARALAPQPKLLLLDEPLSALDLKLRKEMQVELKRIQHETGITFIFVTHDQEEALTMSDRIAVMSRGQILQIGTPREIYAHPTNRFVADFIGETNFLRAAVKGGRAVLGPGVELPLAAGTADGEVTLAIRPEHIRLVPEGAAGALSATVGDATYFGTDSHVHLTLADGTGIVARQQTDPEGTQGPQAGAVLGVTFPPSAVQVLED